MRSIVHVVTLLGCCLLVSACGPVKTPVTNTYTLSVSPTHHQHKKALPVTLLISKPEAMAGFRTEEMLYLKKPYALEPFAKNAWQSPPANMLYPLLVKRFQSSHAFRAISSSPYADKADYRLDTQLIEIYQDFMYPKSQLVFKTKVALTRVADNRVLASKLIAITKPCPDNSPYGGVIAANQIMGQFVESALNFTLREIRLDHDMRSK